MFQVIRYHIGMSATRYTLPLRVRKRGESLRRPDDLGTNLAYVYFEDEPMRRAVVKRVSSADARAIAQAIARALTAGGNDGKHELAKKASR